MAVLLAGTAIVTTAGSYYYYETREPRALVLLGWFLFFVWCVALVVGQFGPAHMTVALPQVDRGGQ